MDGKPFLALFVVAGVLLQQHQPELARRLARVCPLVLLALVVSLLTTGAHQPGVAFSEAHRWLGHAMIICGWIATWFAVGVMLARWSPGSRLRTVGQCTVFFAAFALVLLAAFTGYLVPWDDGATTTINEVSEAGHGSFGPELVGDATMNRFVVLHMVVIPALVTSALFGWWFVFRPKGTPP